MEKVLVSVPPDVAPSGAHGGPGSLDDGFEDVPVDCSMKEIFHMDNASLIKERNHEDFFAGSAPHWNLSSVLSFGQPHLVPFF